MKSCPRPPSPNRRVGSQSHQPCPSQCLRHHGAMADASGGCSMKTVNKILCKDFLKMWKVIKEDPSCQQWSSICTHSSACGPTHTCTPSTYTGARGQKREITFRQHIDVYKTLTHRAFSTCALSPSFFTMSMQIFKNRVLNLKATSKTVPIQSNLKQRLFDLYQLTIKLRVIRVGCDMMTMATKS